MKNLYAISHPSPYAASSILIAAVVCFAGVSRAEVMSKYKQSDWNQKASSDYQMKESMNKNLLLSSRQNLNSETYELSKPKNNFADFIKFQETERSGNQKLIKRNSDDFNRDTDETKNDLEADGYGYDDDEYYHLEFKRNDDTTSKTDSKEAMQEDPNKKEEFQNQKFNFGQKPLNPNDKDKESQTVEMLSFKESHPVIGSDNSMTKNNVAHPLMSNVAHKKLPSQPVSSLNMKDLKENSAIDEKMKDRKDESSGLSSSAVTGEQKADGKKSVKVKDEKEALNLKDSKYGEEPEKKEKEVNVSVKEDKDSMAGNAIKDGKDKLASELKNSAKGSDNLKLEDNIEKISSKSKERFTAKISGNDQDSVKLNGKLNSEAVNSNEMSQSGNRASFVSSEFKNNGKSMKTQAIDEREKDSEEFNEKNIGLNEYEDELREKESLRDGEAMANYEYRTNDGYNIAESQQAADKKNDYMTIPITFEIKQENLNDFYKEQNGWKDLARANDPQQVQQQSATYDHSNEESLRLALPQSELENTDFHKNYLKSLKKYKGLETHQKILSSDRYSNDNSKVSGIDEFISEPAKRKTTKKRKRSKVSKRKSSNSYITTDMQEPVNANDLKNIYSQLNAMQFLQLQQQRQPQQSAEQPPQDPRSLSYGSSGREEQSSLTKTNYGISKDSNRETRKSPTKLEYEIKIINQNQRDVAKDAPLLKISSSQKRRRKNVETNSNDRFAEKFIKKYPYSQISKDELTRFGDSKNGLIQRKFKRTSPAWQDQLEENNLKNKGAPSGYYGNRVKFGQKHYAPKDVGQSGAAYLNSNNDGSSFSSKKFTSDIENNYLQKSWRNSAIQPAKHDAIKRYDDNAIFGKNHQNSLLLVKKDKNGERITKTFVDANSKAESDVDLNSDQLAKILSKDNDYIVLKKTDKNKFQKVEDSQGKPINDGTSLNKNFEIFDRSKLEALKESNQHNRNLFVRSYRSNDQKLHNQGTKSNLKKTFEKFKDFADFFKDSDQESTDNRQPSQEVKDGSEIVFSEDKIPDPIVITGDLDGTTSNVKTQPNSMPSISNNFKTIDQEKKTNDLMKFEDSKKDFLLSKELSEKSSWEPALKNVFPEAKSINSMQKNGNEIIVLDFDRNHIKTDQGNKVVLLKPIKETLPFETRNEQLYLPFGSVQKTPNIPLNIAGNRQIEVVLNEDSLPTFLQTNSGMNKNLEKNSNKQSKLNENQQTSMVMTIPNGQQPVITLPLDQYSQIPNLLRQGSEKKLLDGGYKATSKKSLNPLASNTAFSENFNQFLRDYRELSQINRDAWPLKKVKLNKKRNSLDYSSLPPSSFPELSSYSGANIRQLHNILQNMVNNENDYDTTGSKLGIAKNSESRLEKRPKWQYGGAEIDSGLFLAPQRDLTPILNSQKLFDDGKYQYNARDGYKNFFRSDRTLEGGADENDYQNELLQALSAASKKIQRLRREGIAEKELREVIKKTLPLRRRRSLELPVKELANVRDSKPNINFENDEVVEGIHDRERDAFKKSFNFEEAAGSDGDSHSANFARNEPSKLNTKESRERYRSDRRPKRSPENDFEAKVSNSEVQSKILKNVEEDTDQSVYSPGIRPKSQQPVYGEEKPKDSKEMDDPTRTYLIVTQKSEEIAEKTREPIDCVKNMDNKCIDPYILDLFRQDERHERRKRNVYGSTHSNYKREIDLDESVPNYFQNFLVTSLGLDSHPTAYGNQKRDADKWENKADNKRSMGIEDVFLEKRDVSNIENTKNQNYNDHSEYFKNSNFEKVRSDTGKRSSYPGVKSKLQDKASDKVKATAEYEESKAPTQIRIQITKASSKEKKSSKPELEENEMVGNEAEMATKEKEYLEKNKFAFLHATDNQKLWPISKYKYPMDFGEAEASNEANQMKYYVMARPFRRARRKKKKYIQENPMKPIKDFIAFDQKAMEGLVRKYFADQNIQRVQPNQKLPAANHLPQVETVYNPTQSTNKAQVDSYKSMLKVNSLSNKNSVNGKNSFQSNDASAYDEGLLRSYLKDKSIRPKNDKQAAKEFEDVDWKPYARQRPNSKPVTQQEMPNYKPYSTGTQPVMKGEANLKKSAGNQMKWYQVPNTNYMNENPSSMNLFNPGASSNPLKLKPSGQFWNLPNKENPNPMKGWRKLPNYMIASPYAKELKEKSAAEDAWNMFDGYLSKRPIADKYKLRNSFGGLTDPVKMRFNPYKYYRTFEEEKPALLESLQQPRILDQDTDYLDNLDDEYIESDDVKQEPQLVIDQGKKEGKFYVPSRYPNLYSYKNIDLDEMLNDDEEEADEDYDENAEETADEYSFLSPPNLLSSEMTKKLNGENDKLRGSYYVDESLYAPAKATALQLHGSNFEQTELQNPKTYGRLEPETNQMTLREVKNEIDSLGSSDILKKVNENSNILGKNLMKNLNRYNYDENVKGTEKMMENRAAMLNYRNSEIRSSENLNKKNLDWQAKLKRSQGLSPVGSRLFYAAKTEMPESRDMSPQSAHLSQGRNNRNIYYHLPKRNPRNAQLEYPKNNNKFLGPKSVNGESGENDRKSEESMDLRTTEDVEGNMEDDSETISEDNVLENVIGKYLMRKSVAPESNDIKNAGGEKESSSKLHSRESLQHKREKKSPKNEIYSESQSNSKVWQKRLSSGHLTENNFKKYHKKNLNHNRKSKAIDFDRRPADDEPEIDLANESSMAKEDAETKMDKTTFENQWNIKGKKRSALNIFKKLGGKDRDGKKDNSADIEMVGFEPILSMGESKFEFSLDDRADGFVRKADSSPLATTFNGNKKVFSPSAPSASPSAPSSEDSRLTEKKKEKSKAESSQNEGPWKIDLNEKYDEKLKNDNHSKESGKSSLSSVDKVTFASGATSPDVKAYLVLRDNVLSQRGESQSTDASKAISNASEMSKKEKPAGDKRPVDEATSEYLGQRIVDAILSKVSKNPRFKKTIEPGLTGKAFKKWNKFENLNRNEDYSEQMQSLLQKIMFDIEKIAERHVKKRMCNKIDKKSQEFLHSLLEVSVDNEVDPGENQAGKMDAKLGAPEFQYSKTCSSGIFHACDPVDQNVGQASENSTSLSTSPSSNPSRSTLSNPDSEEMAATRLNDKMCETLKKKQNTLLKLIDDYHKLSELEKHTISVNYEYLKNELEQTNRLLSSLTGKNYQSAGKTEGETTVSENPAPKQNAMEIREKGFEGGTKCDIQNVTLDEPNDNSKAKSTAVPEKMVFQFEPSERQDAIEETESVLEEKTTTVASPQPSQPEQDPKDQGFESVGEKMDTSQSLSETSTQAAPMKNDMKLKGYSSPVFVHFKATGKEKTGRISKDDISKTAKTSIFLKDQNFRTGTPEVGEESKDLSEHLTALNDLMQENGIKSGKKYQKLYFEDSFDEYPMEQINSHSDCDRNFVEMSRAKRHRDRANILPSLGKLTKKKGCADDSDFEENPALEYLIWSSMPTVRRRLNNLELGDQFRSLPLEDNRKKK